MSDARASGPAPSSVRARVYRMVDERFQISDLVTFLGHKAVPIGSHSMIWYYLGGVSLFFFVVQIVTGILLLMNYQVGENTSYESMKHLVGRVPFGWLVRSIHCWSAHLMSLTVMFHLFSVLFLKAYRKPRELTWYSGFAMLGLVLGFGFSGYLLPWNELSYFATAVGTDSVKSVPIVGPWMLRVLRGGEEVSVQTLYRFFALHVCILPLIMAGLIGAHLLFIQRQGMAEPLEHEPSPEPKTGPHGMPFFPNFAMRDVLFWVICLNILALLAVALPFGPGIPGMEWELGEKANPIKPAYPGIKPEWYFLSVYQMLREFPAHLFGMEGPQACLLLASILGAIAFAIPLLDRNAAKGKPSPLFTDLGVAGLLFLGFLTLKAWDVGVHAPPGKDPAGDPVMAATIARTAALWILGIGLAATALRRLKWGHSAFSFTAAVLLQAALNGFAHLSWLVSGGIALVVLAVLLLAGRVRGGASAAGLLLPLLLMLVAPSTARADEKGAAPATATASLSGHVVEDAWPADFKKLYLAAEKNVPVLDEKARARFKALPTHAQELFFAAAKAGTLSGATHLAALLALDVDDRKVELLLGDNCFLCHSNPDLPDEILFKKRDKGDPLAHLDLREVVSDVHFRGGLMCAGCHGGKPTDLEMSAEIGKRWPASEVRHKDRSWIPEFCARCHSSSEFMQSYNPSLPVDQLLKYRTSRHGRLLLEKKDSKAAQCVSCHGVHGIRPPDSTNSLVYRENIPATCGKCHADAAYMKGYTKDDGVTPIPTNQLAQYKKSVHGLALLGKHDSGAPACNGCHGNHAALPPQTKFVSQVCRTCHAANGSLFDGSPHKKAFQAHSWPECATCHGNHDIAVPTDEFLGTDPKALCHDCHKRYGTPKCEETATFFYNSIVELRDSHAALEKDVNRLAERGLDVDELRFQSSAVYDALNKTRLGIHTFDLSDFVRNSQATSRAVKELKQGTQSVWKEYGYRRNGLLLATAVISIFGVLLYLKIKQTDREPRPK